MGQYWAWASAFKHPQNQPETQVLLASLKTLSCLTSSFLNEYYLCRNQNPFCYCLFTRLDEPLF